ncbi:MAG: hypothetical protein ACI83P_000682 [Janthinobacterium sp.]
MVAVAGSMKSLDAVMVAHNTKSGNGRSVLWDIFCRIFSPHSGGHTRAAGSQLQKHWI